MLKLSPYIVNQPKISYAKETDDRHLKIDCSAGSNPYGFPLSVRSAAESLAGHDPMLCDYPHGTELKQAIAEYWSGCARLDIANILLCNGSIDGIYQTNLLFQRKDAAVLGICPQFSDYVMNARLLGYKYTGVQLLKEENYRFFADRLIDRITPELSLIYIDNPNNPTGQMIPLDDMERILSRARECGVCVLADEAYGDFFDRDRSAAALLDGFDNLIVLRTFSKGLGLAGLRAGYIMTDKELASQFDKLSNPYMIAQPSRVMAQASLSGAAFLSACRAEFAASKAAIREQTGGALHMAHTFDDCPIMLLWHSDPNIDLASEFAEKGVKVYSGADFETLGINSVRLRVPKKTHMEELLRVVQSING